MSIVLSCTQNADCDGSISGELNLGDPESGYLTQTNLLSISLRINQEWKNIGINLGISYDQLERIRNQHRWASDQSQQRALLIRTEHSVFNTGLIYSRFDSACDLQIPLTISVAFNDAIISEFNRAVITD